MQGAIADRKGTAHARWPFSRVFTGAGRCLAVAIELSGRPRRNSGRLGRRRSAPATPPSSPRVFAHPGAPSITIAMDRRRLTALLAKPGRFSRRTALRHDREQTDRFVGTFAGTAPVPECFAPDTIGRILGGAPAGVA